MKSHIWLKDTDWNAIITKKQVSPYIPSLEKDNFDAFQANAIDKWNEENQDLMKRNLLLLKQRKTQELFTGYYYNQDTDIELIKKEKRPVTTASKPSKRHRKTFSLRW